GDGEPGEEDRLLLRVRDTGSGMDQDTMSRVFDPFFTTREDGTGLGLASVHTIVTSLGGEVTVGSLPGEGTTFTVSLPLAAAPEPAATSPDEPSLASGHQPGD